MRRSQFLLSVVLNRLVFTLPFVLVLLAFAYVVFGVVVHGSLAALAVVILMGAAAFMGIGLLGEYIGRIYYDVRARPRFIIESVIGQD